MSELIKRIITGIVLIYVVGLALMLDGVYIKSLLCIIAVLASWEFYQMFFKGNRKLIFLSVGLCILLLMEGFFYEPAAKNPELNQSYFLLLFVIIASISLVRWVKYGNNAFIDGNIIIVGLIYIPSVLLLFPYFNPYEKFFIFLLPAINDTSAYLIGFKAGKTKIWPEVSPKKSIEGSVAGLIGSVLFTMVYCGFFGNAHILIYALLGALLSAVAQFGDFFESALKRATQVKDSSHILPGHGGILDRIDSILFVIPVLYFLLMTFPQLRF